MNEVRPHIIHKQIIEVELPRGRSAAVLQDRIRNCWYDRILPRLDNVFSSLVDEAVIIRVDKLSLDLGEVSETMLEQQLTAKALESIEKMLKEKLRFEVDASNGVSAVPVRKADAEILLYFLTRGRLPWWSPVKDLDRLEATMMEAGMLPGGFSERFLLAIADPAVMRRLSFQFSRPFLQFLAACCIPSFEESGYATVDPAEALAAFSSGGYFRFSAETSASGESAATVGSTPADEDRQRDAGDNLRSGTDQPVDAAEMEMTNENVQAERTDGRRAEERSDEINLAGATSMARQPEEQSLHLPASGKEGSIASGTEQSLSGRPDQVPSGKGTTAIPGASGNEKKHPDEKERWVDAALRLRGNETRRNDAALRDDEALYIELAGLVILHPFLKPFFEALELTAGRAFRDEASMHKAVHLLGYLATGETDIQEQRLILPKLICGMAWTAPIERTGIITEADRTEAENLLTATIAHWKALKNASPDALREGFLQREGKLTQRENGWQLDVEKKTLDILMGSMPWGISMVKYPWMKALLFVNWG